MPVPMESLRGWRGSTAATMPTAILSSTGAVRARTVGRCYEPDIAHIGRQNKRERRVHAESRGDP